MTTDARDELAELIRKAGWDAQDSPDYEKCGFDSDVFIADAILAAGWRAPLPDRPHLWAQWNAEWIHVGRRARTNLGCARCGLWYSQWHGDDDCPK